MWLVVVDAHSKWPEVIQMPTTSTAKTIEALRSLFASYGLPEQLVSDNGPQFIAEDFRKFMRQNSIQHVKCAPYHPASNGAVERFNQTFKRAMKSANRQGAPLLWALNNFLLVYRSTPHATTGETPSSLFLKRAIRTRLDLLKPDCSVYVRMKQSDQKHTHDQHSKDRIFEEGEGVQIRNFRDGPDWVSGVVMERRGPLTYLVKTNIGKVWLRHADHLRKGCQNRNFSETDKNPDQVSTNEPTETELLPTFDDKGQTQAEPICDNLAEASHVPTAAERNTPPEVIEPESTRAVSSTPPRPQLHRSYPKRNRRPPDRYSGTLYCCCRGEECGVCNWNV